MERIIIILLCFFSALQLSSQEVCATEKEVIVDINTINKCAVEKTTDSNKNTVASSKRYLKRRVYLNEVVYLASNLKAKTNLSIKVNNKLDANLLLKIKELESRETTFDSVEKIPLFLSCQESTLDNVTCFNYKMQEHIVNNFVYPEKALELGIEGDLDVSFVIGVNGEVGDIKIKGVNNESDILKKEAKRIVLLLPKFKAGENKGVKIPVLYNFPMSFTLE